MSITEELIRLRQAKEDLRNAINAKGGSLTSEKLDLYAEAVLNLKNSSGTVNPDNAGSSGSSVMDFYKCTSLINEQNVDYIVTSAKGVADLSLAGTRFRLTRYPEWDHTFKYRIPESTEDVEGNAAMYYYVRDDGETVYCVSASGFRLNSSYLYSKDEFPQNYLSPEVHAWGTLETVDIQEWSGNKAILTDGVYSFEENVTSGLTFGGGFTPVVGKIYDSEALVRVDKLFEGFIIPEGYVLYIPFNTKEGSAATGQSLEYYNEGSVTATTDSGIHCTHFDGGSIRVGYGNLPSGDLSISYWCKFTGTEWGIIYTQPGINTWAGPGGVNVGAYTQWGLNGNVDSTQWFHFAVTRSGDFIKVYINGVLAASETQSMSVSDSYARIGTHFNYNDLEMFKGYLAGLRVYNRALTADEVTNLSKEFKV